MSSTQQAKPIYVIDYVADGKPGKPRRLHRTDCPHTDQGQTFRKATPTELRTLRECADCARAR